MRCALAWTSTQIAAARSPDALLVVASDIERVADAVIGAPFASLERAAAYPWRSPTSPGLWQPAERVVAGLAPQGFLVQPDGMPAQAPDRVGELVARGTHDQ